ncbi:MAG: PIN domain-containing protein, partial [Nitrosopumilaceae archaeon]|nr:type II toxin-antitoxin system VapC family toxin [Nitrosopumilaceae archaeon]NIX62302.1 PIN domain-containing protein [Nitrosopumilaceae archaeon]
MYLIDTDILIYSMKNHPVVRENFRKHEEKLKAISVISYGELYFGARKSKYSEKNLASVRRINELFTIIDITKTIMENFGDLKASLQTKGKTVPD